jgi:hypothetical protein
MGDEEAAHYLKVELRTLSLANVPKESHSSRSKARGLTHIDVLSQRVCGTLPMTNYRKRARKSPSDRWTSEKSTTVSLLRQPNQCLAHKCANAVPLVHELPNMAL